jgi:hypothetical protein
MQPSMRLADEPIPTQSGTIIFSRSPALKTFYKNDTTLYKSNESVYELGFTPHDMQLDRAPITTVALSSTLACADPDCAYPMPH